MALCTFDSKHGEDFVEFDRLVERVFLEQLLLELPGREREEYAVYVEFVDSG